MLRVTLKSLLARKLRLLLSGFAVVLGVAFVSGSYVLTDSLGRVFDNLFGELGRNTAVQVQGKSVVNDQDREPVPQAVLDQVRHVDGVREAIGTWYAQGITVLDKKGKPYTKNGPPTQGASIDPTSSQEDYEIVRGKAPVGGEQVALDSDTASTLGFALGDTVTIDFKGPTHRFELVGIVRLGNRDNLAGATLAALDPPTAQRLLGTPGTWLQLRVAAVPGVEVGQLVSRIGAVLPPGFEAVSQQQASDQASKDVKEGLGFFSTFLLAFGGISLFVGAFLIFNTFSMLIAQRTRELALLRALGASRAQVTRSVLVESLVVGVFASLVGFALGLGVAAGLRALLGAVGAQLPDGPTVVALRTFIVSMLVGIVITCVAALVPARRAARIAPVQAMRESGPAEDRSLVRRTALGSLILSLGVVALLFGLGDGELRLVGLGAALSFLGVAVLSPLVARPVVGAVGLVFARWGVPSRLGRGNAMRSPRRTSSTAAALMIGVGLVAMVSTTGESLKKSAVKLVATSLGADYVLHTQQYDGFDPAVGVALEGRPGLAAVAPFRASDVKVDGKREFLQGVDPTLLTQVLTLDVQHGSFAQMAQGRLAVSDKIAKQKGLQVGETVSLTWAKTGAQKLVVGAIYKTNNFAGDYLVSQETFDANVTKPLDTVVAIKATGDPARNRQSIEAALKPYPRIEIEDRAEFIKAQGDQVDQLITILTALLAFSVIIAMLGVVNTLALSVVERTRELGLLRAVGLQRRQLRRMIRVESVLITIYGALLGIAIGIAFGAALVNALHDVGVTEFAIPIRRLLVVLAAAALAGVLAAALPARRAARMDVLQAINTA